MEVQFLGGASEVGRLGMLLRHQGATLLFDYGIQPSDPPRYPLEAPPVDALLLTHSHLDHCGLVPVVCRQYDTDLLATPVTLDVTEILLEDSIKVSKAEGYREPFTLEDVWATGRNAVTVAHGDQRDLGEVQVEVHPAGHIPGSSMYLVNGRRRVLFTGDLQVIDTHLLRGAEPVDCDVLILESTYAGRDHAPRATTEAQFRERVRQVVDRGGLALVPCFAVSRTQEVLMALADMDCEIWVDGMGRAVSDVYLQHPESLRSFQAYKRALGRARMVRHHRNRQQALKGEVILTTGGMLDGGPVLHYLDHLKDDPRSEVLLTGYQVEGTNGRRLVEEGLIEVRGVRIPVRCPVSSHDFSAHAGHRELVEFVEGCDPERVILMHGESREALQDALEGREVLLPREGERYAL